MKKLFLLLVSFSFCVVLAAEDLVLKNGKVYHDYKVIRKDKKGIKIRYTVYDGTLNYSRVVTILYQDLKEEDQAKFTGCKIKYKITGAKEVDIFLIPANLKRPPSADAVIEGRDSDPEMAIIHSLLLINFFAEAYKKKNETKKTEAGQLLFKFPFRATLVKLCDYRKLNTTPVGEAWEVPQGKYWFIAFKKGYTDSGYRYYLYDAEIITINQRQTNIELNLEDAWLCTKN